MHGAIVGLLILAGWFFVVAGYMGGENTKPSGWNLLNVGKDLGYAAWGWAQKEVTPKFQIGGVDRWFVTWEIASMGIGAALLVASRYTEGVVRGLALLHGVLFLLLPIWGLFSGL